MNLMMKVLRYEIHNTIRSKWVILYTFFFFLLGYTLFSLSSDVNKAYISLMNIVLIVIPLVSLIFGAIYLYSSREFIEMMLSQPIDRKSLFTGIYFGTSIPLAAGYLIGIVTPFLIFGKVKEQTEGLMFLVLIGIALTFVFTAISFLITVLQDDKAKGLGLIILIWLIFSVIYDGIMLFVVYYFEEYPLEKVIIALSVINPIDLGRILFLMKFNISALMGYTGAVFQSFFGSTLGVLLSAIGLLLWIAVPLFFSTKIFRKKDF
ncbi:MAG: ABC transporter permease subunit [Ignavibacteriaceae bacterium]|nr:ABC transporter permease [Ignavibacteria bacterium]NNJ51889.1 ABC transporter permease subunit [Ignavibacteriaceae bacterium]